MITEAIMHSVKVIEVAIAGLVVVKLSFFLRYKDESYSYMNLLFFPADNLTFTSDTKLQTLKRLQNKLTIVVVALALLYYAIYRFFGY